MSQPDQNRHVFTINDKTNEKTNRPYGDKYQGEFIVRRPTLRDKREVSLRQVAMTSQFGMVDPNHLTEDTINMAHVFAFFAVCGEKVPDWLDEGATYEEDMGAIVFAFKEVSRWLDTFRSS